MGVGWSHVTVVVSRRSRERKHCIPSQPPHTYRRVPTHSSTKPLRRLVMGDNVSQTQVVKSNRSAERM
eukprot:CAMPEP_0194516946 /NCGR_PEP_ID=MMETSP0253-20130528/49998_1 /TAXON_ID=2966 /ORGANISM="Noctiluca scintillans" /LENGTH=67 /DNA_ID=CAMNT_0039360861 /DNA_START=640 /DNA_END=843 /DNA_ORIENTATION=-